MGVAVRMQCLRVFNCGDNLPAFGFMALAAAVFFTLFSTPPAHATATALSAGTTHTCAVVDGTAKCWGDNTSGKLGNNSTTSTTTPVAVYTKAPWSEQVDVCDAWFVFCTRSHKETVQHPGSPLYGKSVTKISAGDTHTCAIANARVYCWGDNSDGQLGNRTSGWLTNSTTPVAVAIDGNSALLGKEVVDVSVGAEFTCALASDGAAACWGSNGNGQLGNGSIVNKNYPASVSISTKLKKLAVLKGRVATMCAITRKDTAICWGQNDLGQAGVGNAASVTQDGSGYFYKSHDNHQCKLTLNYAIAAARKSLPQDMNDVLYPTQVGNGKYASLIIVAGHKWNDAEKAVVATFGGESVDSWIYRYINWSQNNNSNLGVNTQPYGFEGTDYAYVTGLTTESSSDVNRAYWWGGSKRFTAYLTCAIGGGGNGWTKSEAALKRSYVTQPLPTGPLYASGATALTDQPLSLISGNGYPNTDYGSTFCALRSTSNTAYCDVHGASRLDQGQAGNNYTTPCTSTKNSMGVITTTCTPDPTGPQPVYAAGWLAGKTVTAIDTGFADRTTTHTCVIASGKVGCWGSNDSGQLGVGDKLLRKQAAGVSL